MQQTFEYYRDKLGFGGEWTFGNNEGGIRRDDPRLLFAEDESFTNDVNNKNHRFSIMWPVDHINEVCHEFKNRNIHLADELRTHPYELREFAFVDINSYSVLRELRGMKNKSEIYPGIGIYYSTQRNEK